MTGFSPDNPKENRPYLVIGHAGQMVRVVPQSTVGDNGVYVPDGVVNGLEAGWFVPWSKPIPVRLAARLPVIGFLPAQYVERVREQWRGGRAR